MNVAADGRAASWRGVRELMTRPQPVTLPMVALFALVPMYLVVGEFVSTGRTLHVPEIGLDRAMALRPEWSLVYLSLFLAAFLPVFVIHQQELVRRTIFAFIFVWVVALAMFIAYPTLGPRPAKVGGDDFAAWTLRLIYSSDHRYNCLPSLHVAQCFVAAFACGRVHRGVGAAALAWAFLVAVSVVYTKQHYVLDAVSGALLAGAAYVLVLRSYPRDAVPRYERIHAPLLATCAAAIYGATAMFLWVLYLAGFTP